MAQPLKITLYGALVYDLAEVLQRKLATSATITRLKEDAGAAALREALSDSDVLLAMDYRDMPPAHRLRLLQIPGAGTDRVNLAEVPSAAYVCNAYGHDIAGAEYVLAGILAWCYDLIEAHESFKAGSWRMSGRYGAPIHHELHGKTVGILGLGPIGLKTAELAKAFGTRILACNRTARPQPAWIDAQYPLSRLHEFLDACDFVVVSIALTPETTGLIDAAGFAAMRPNAVIVNVSRGPVIDEDALFDALQSRRIAGAVIDAWYRYPMPPDLTTPPSKHPFHQLSNIIMTPHSSIWTHGMIDRRWTEIAANIDALARGEPLINIVRKPAARSAAAVG